MKLDKVYEEKVYAGVLGKLIGVYLGQYVLKKEGKKK